MNLKRLLFVASFCLISVSAFADRLDDYIRGQVKDRHIPAVVFGVFKDGKMLRSGAYGLSNVELGVKANVDDVFEIGSVSKQFTATVILQLMQEGKLGLEDPISKYVDGLPETWKSISLSHLLNHTSGIPDIEEIFGYDSYRNIYTVPQIIAVANSMPIEFAPGQKWHYSNTNYYLLGLALEKIIGKPYGVILKERIFEPLGMTHTRESDPFSVILNRASGYQLKDGKVLNRDAMQPTACLGAGTLVSTIADMAKWDSAINHNRFLTPETQKLMWTPTKVAAGEVVYGYAWFISPWRNFASVEHSGGTAGFSCDYRRFQDLGISVMVFSNLYGNPVEDFVILAADSVSPGISYMSLKSKPDPNPDVRAMLIKAMKSIGDGGEVPSFYTANMWDLYTPAARAVWKERTATMKSFEFLEHEKFEPVTMSNKATVVETYLYRLTGPKQTILVKFFLTADGKIGAQQRLDY